MEVRAGTLPQNIAKEILNSIDLLINQEHIELFKIGISRQLEKNRRSDYKSEGVFSEWCSLAYWNYDDDGLSKAIEIEVIDMCKSIYDDMCKNKRPDAGPDEFGDNPERGPYIYIAYNTK